MKWGIGPNMEKIAISELIYVMKEICEETKAVLEGIRKSLYIKRENELVNPGKVEFGIAKYKQDKQGVLYFSINQNLQVTEHDCLENIIDEDSIYVLKIRENAKFSAYSNDFECNCRLFNGEVSPAHESGLKLDKFEAESKIDFLNLNSEILLRVLEEVNKNRKYMTYSGLNFWQTTNQYNGRSYTIQATSETTVPVAKLHVNNTSVGLKILPGFLIVFDVLKNELRGQALKEIYSDLSDEEQMAVVKNNYFDKFFISVTDLPEFWQARIKDRSQKLNRKKEN